MIQVPTEQANNMSEPELVQWPQSTSQSNTKDSRLMPTIVAPSPQRVKAQMDNLQRQIVKIELELVESRNMVSFLEKECDRLKNSNQEVVNLRTQVSQRDEILQDKSMLISTLQNQIKVMQAEKVDADQATLWPGTI